MPKYPWIYEINTRPWLKQFGERATLSEVPPTYWKELRAKGVDIVWLMGVWQTTQSSIVKHCFHPDLKKAYSDALPHWTEKDVGGSPYAIEDYVLSKALGKPEELKRVHRAINDAGLSLILDFVPNHFNTESSLILKHPEVFLQVNAHVYDQDNYSYFERSGKYFAHGKDPYFPAWSDTVQVNYFSEEAQFFMIDRLVQVAQVCDGVRCDMAMLMLPDIFEKTWIHIANEKPEKSLSFWPRVIGEVRRRSPGFIMVAESYWDTPWQLQQIGFDFTYDKDVLDHLKSSNFSALHAHLGGTLEYQNSTVRFIENHDEERSRNMGMEKAKAAATLLMTIPGAKLFFDRQWQGESVRYPVQLETNARITTCPCVFAQGHGCFCLSRHYEALIKIASKEIFKEGNWIRITSNDERLLVSLWHHQGEELLVIVNLSGQQVRTTLHLPATQYHDALNKTNNPCYLQMREDKMLAEFPAYASAVFSKNRN